MMGPLPTLGRTEGPMAWAPAMGVITKVSHTLLIVKICSYLFSQRPVMIHGNLAKWKNLCQCYVVWELRM